MKKFILIPCMLLLSGMPIHAQTETVNQKERLINYTSRFSAGFLGGDAFSTSFLTHHGINIGRHFETTVGLGLEKYYDRRYAPILLDFQYNILNRKTTPYIRVLGGYLLDIERNGQSLRDTPGYTLGGGIGLKTRINDHLSIFTEVGFRHSTVERMEYYYWDWFGPVPTIVTNANRLELRVGIGFK